jgi:hypothetical protein
MRNDLLGIVSALAMAFACTQPPAPPPDGSRSGAPRTSEQARDWAQVEALEREAQAIARASGCTSTSGCRTAPVGNRACGGPRYYIVYCAASTDSAALFAKLDEVSRAENAYNQKYGIMSTCEFRMPPEVTVVGGECRAR